MAFGPSIRSSLSKAKNRSFGQLSKDRVSGLSKLFRGVEIVPYRPVPPETGIVPVDWVRVVVLCKPAIIPGPSIFYPGPLQLQAFQ